MFAGSRDSIQQANHMRYLIIYLWFWCCWCLNWHFVTFAANFLLSVARTIAGTSQRSSFSKTAWIRIQTMCTSQPQDNVRRVRRPSVARISRSANDTVETYNFALLHGWVSCISMRDSQFEASNVFEFFSSSNVANETRVHDVVHADTNKYQGFRAQKIFWLRRKARIEPFVHHRCGLLHCFVYICMLLLFLLLFYFTGIRGVKIKVFGTSMDTPGRSELLGSSRTYSVTIV